MAESYVLDLPATRNAHLASAKTAGRVRLDDGGGSAAGAASGDAQMQVGRGALQTGLAIDRTILAVERTYDAWVRTGLAALASGVGARALLTHVVPQWLMKSTGAALVLFAAFCFMAGAWREMSTAAQLPPSHMRHLPPAMLVIVNGFLVLVALAAFAGVVTAP